MPDKKKGDEGGFGKFLWNGETGELLGRTGGSWGKERKIYMRAIRRFSVVENVLSDVMNVCYLQEKSSFSTLSSLPVSQHSFCFCYTSSSSLLIYKNLNGK